MTDKASEEGEPSVEGASGTLPALEDNAIAPPRRLDEAKEDAAVVLRNLGHIGEDRKPLRNDDDLASNRVRMGSTEGLDPGSATLANFLGMRPFLKTFFWVADRVGDDDLTVRQRSARLKSQHPKAYGTCLFLDLLLVFICCGVIVTLAVLVGWKTVFGQI